MDKKLYFEEIGDDFIHWASDYDVGRRIDLIKSMMPLDSMARSCLEVGCGYGAISEALMPLVGTLTVTDISGKLAAVVGVRLGIIWSRQDACALDIPPESFDLVVSSECIEHTENPRLALSEMARVLKPNGILIVTSPNRLWIPSIKIASWLKLRNFDGIEDWLFPWASAAALKAKNLKILRISGCHLFPWQIPFAKHLLPYFDQCGHILYPLMINYGILAAKPLSSKDASARDPRSG
jgi:2-polyprenyl-6-hydroxyphenyl methylase/3-demethylubiquinone-9 3-methyltransferase